MELSDRTPSAAKTSVSPDNEHSPLRVIASHDIFLGEREVRIEHDEAVYRLRLTRKGKLILHK